MIVVLGCHGGGTSLIAGILHKLGVRMSYNPRAKIHSGDKTYLNYEDSNFVRINCAILHANDGNWRTPPDRVELNDGLRQRMKVLIEKREREARGGLWGFKDPRTALTVESWHSFLPDPIYVVVTRDINDVAKSLAARGHQKSDPEKFVDMVESYYCAILDFVVNFEPAIEAFRFEDIINRPENTIDEIALFLGIEEYDLPSILEVIQ